MSSVNLRFINVSFSYNTTSENIISSLSVHFCSGWTGIAGPNGAGKTTINDDLNWFADRDVVKKWVNPDTGKTVVQVNGKEPAFRAGELG